MNMFPDNELQSLLLGVGVGVLVLLAVAGVAFACNSPISLRAPPASVYELGCYDRYCHARAVHSFHSGKFSVTAEVRRPAGESRQTFTARVLRAVEELLQRHAALCMRVFMEMSDAQHAGSRWGDPFRPSLRTASGVVYVSRYSRWEEEQRLQDSNDASCAPFEGGRTAAEGTRLPLWRVGIVFGDDGSEGGDDGGDEGGGVADGLVVSMNHTLADGSAGLYLMTLVVQAVQAQGAEARSDEYVRVAKALLAVRGKSADFALLGSDDVDAGVVYEGGGEGGGKEGGVVVRQEPLGPPMEWVCDMRPRVWMVLKAQYPWLAGLLAPFSGQLPGPFSGSTPPVLLGPAQDVEKYGLAKRRPLSGYVRVDARVAERLRRQARKHGVSLHSLLAGMSALASARTLAPALAPDAAAVAVSNGHPVGMARRSRVPVPPGGFRTHVGLGAVTHVVSVGPDSAETLTEQIWRAARETQSAVQTEAFADQAARSVGMLAAIKGDFPQWLARQADQPPRNGRANTCAHSTLNSVVPRAAPAASPALRGVWFAQNSSVFASALFALSTAYADVDDDALRARFAHELALAPGHAPHALVRLLTPEHHRDNLVHAVLGPDAWKAGDRGSVFIHVCGCFPIVSAKQHAEYKQRLMDHIALIASTNSA
jgi:hypothetical protein